MNNIHPILEAIEEASYETELQRNLIGDIIMSLVDLPFVEVAIIHELVYALKGTSVLNFKYSVSEMLEQIEKGDLITKPNWNHSETQERGI